MNDFENKILEWSNKIGLYQNTNPEKYLLKLIEELGELSRAILNQNNVNDIMLEVGDIQVVLCQLSKKYNFSFLDAQKAAWNKIKDRKGKIVNGTFIKESDNINE